MWWRGEGASGGRQGEGGGERWRVGERGGEWQVPSTARPRARPSTLRQVSASVKENDMGRSFAELMSRNYKGEGGVELCGLPPGRRGQEGDYDVVERGGRQGRRWG